MSQELLLGWTNNYLFTMTMNTNCFSYIWVSWRARVMYVEQAFGYGMLSGRETEALTTCNKWLPNLLQKNVLYWSGSGLTESMSRYRT
ncbi:hypothetical protein [Sinomicrobium sp. M5D2P17]